MAVNIDDVYRTVLTLLNEDTSGSVSVDEFNKMAKQAQLSIMEDYFYEYNGALNDRKRYASNSGYADAAQMIREQIDEVATETTITFSSGTATLPTDAYHILDITSTDRQTKYEEVPTSKLTYTLASPLTAPSASFPIFRRKTNGTEVDVYPNESPLDTATVNVDYIKFPDDPRWGYLEDATTGAYLYDSNTYVADGLVIKEDAFSSFTQNISGGTDGTYSSETATISSGGTIDLDVTVGGGIVTQVDTIEAGSGLSVGDTLTIAASAFGTTGNALVITIAEGNLYSGSTAGSTDFLLHQSEETRLIREILSQAGLALRDADIINAMSAITQSEQIQKQEQ